MNEARKLAILASHWGMSVLELLEQYHTDSIVPAICVNEECEYTTEYEPDQRYGWCESCGTRSVRSALVLAGVI